MYTFFMDTNLLFLSLISCAYIFVRTLEMNCVCQQKKLFFYTQDYNRINWSILVNTHIHTHTMNELQISPKKLCIFFSKKIQETDFWCHASQKISWCFDIFSVYFLGRSVTREVCRAVRCSRHDSQCGTSVASSEPKGASRMVSN